MKMKKGFTIYNMADEYMLIPVGEEMASFGGTVVLNEVSAFLLEQMKEEHRTIDQLVDAVLAEYDAEEKTVRADVTEAIAAMRQNGILEE